MRAEEYATEVINAGTPMSMTMLTTLSRFPLYTDTYSVGLYGYID